MPLTSPAPSAAQRSTFNTDPRDRRRQRSRGTILVASDNTAWLSVIASMVVDSGFTPAYAAESEAAWLSTARTHPCIAICDCDIPVERIQRLVLEAWARHVPVLVSATGRSTKARSLQPRRVARFKLPVSSDAFCSMLDGLLPPHPPHRPTRMRPTSL
jgi:CheY-like chemotaxis protein